MLPEEKARVKIDKQLNNAGWDIVDRQDYIPNYAMAVKEALMQGGKESDYLLLLIIKPLRLLRQRRNRIVSVRKLLHRLNTMQKLRRIGMVFGFRD